MKKTIAAFLASAFLLAATPGLAQAGHKHHDHGAAIAGAFLGGAVLGHVLTQPRPHPAPPPPPGPAFGNCHPTSTVEFVNGRRAEFQAAMCYDGFGRPFIVPESRRFVRYL